MDKKTYDTVVSSAIAKGWSLEKLKEFLETYKNVHPAIILKILGEKQ